MQIRITFDTLYKASLLTGLVVIFATLLISWNQRKVTERTMNGVVEQIILTRLDIISLGEQHAAVLNGLKMNHANGEETLELSESQLQQLEQEKITLESQLEVTLAELKELEHLKKHTSRDITVFIACTVAGLVLGILLCVIGGFGWVYHVKVFEERRNKTRDDQAE